MRRVVAAAGLPALGLGITAIVLTLRSDHAPVALAILNPIIGWSFVTSGLVAWSRESAGRIGRLMVAMGLVWLVGSLQASNESVLFTLGFGVSTLALAIIAQLLLSFPDGRLRSWPARIVTATAYVDATVVTLASLFVFDPTAARFECDDCPPNAMLVSRQDSAAEALLVTQNLIAVAVAVTIIVLLALRWRSATAPARRALAPVLWSGIVAAALGAGLFAAPIAAESAALAFQLATFAALALVPTAFLVGLLRSRLSRITVSRLVVELSGSPAPGRLREAIARALRDPSLQVAYWLPETGSYVDASGQPVELPAEGAGQIVRLVEREGRRIGALVHDEMLREQPELVDGVVAAASMALENERLQAELHVRLDDLRRNEGRLRALIDASPLAIVETDLEGRVTFWNRAAERLYGWTSDEVLGELASFVPRQKAGEIDELRARMLDGEAFEGVETARLRKDGSLVEVVLSAGPVYDASGEIVRYMAVSADISARKRAQEELGRERDFTSTLIDSTACLVIVLDRDARLVRFNRACEQMTGYTFEEVRGRPFWEFFIDPADTKAIESALDRVWAGDFPSSNENDWILRDGRRRLIAWSNTALLGESGEVEYIVASGLDITERKRAEEEVRASRARLVEAQDAARRRLERNLHDGAQQRLVSLSLALRLANSKIPTEPAGAQEMLEAANEELAQALTELRELARGIHPAILTDRGLTAALEALAGRSVTPVELEVALEDRLPPPVEAAAYYVVSEALANVAKYANANFVSVTVARQDGHAHVEVCDDGVGGADPLLGSGLRGLADRVEALDGRLVIESGADCGTRVEATIPIV